jgi:tRNA nucleotidyltransferase/poly(A) polymerase
MELSKILEHPNRQWAWSELARCGLLEHIAPELLPVDQAELFLQLPHAHLELPVVLAALVHPLGRQSPETTTPNRPPSVPEYPIPSQTWRTTLQAIQLRWKLPNATIDAACVCVEASCALANPKPLDWSQVQPKLLHGWVDESMHLAQALCRLHLWSDSGIQTFKERLAQPTDLWNPEPWIKGSDLIRAGLKPGPAFGKLLSQARAMQLDGQWASEHMALEWLASVIQEPERFQRPEQE